MTEPLFSGKLEATAVTIPSGLGAPGAQQSGQPALGGRTPATGDEHGLSGDTKSQTRIVLGRFFRQPLAVFGLGIFALLGIGTVIVGHFWKYNYEQITAQFNAGPTAQHPFGVDGIGHDLFAQVFRGMEKDIQTALLVAVLSAAIGVTIGALAGFFRVGSTASSCESSTSSFPSPFWRS